MNQSCLKVHKFSSKNTKLVQVGYLAVVQLLNNFFIFFTDVTHTDELCLSVTFKKLLPNPLHNCYSWTASGNWAVLNIPEDSNGGQIFQNLACHCNFWGPCTGIRTQFIFISKLQKCWTWHSVIFACGKPYEQYAQEWKFSFALRNPTNHQS